MRICGFEWTSYASVLSRPIETSYATVSMREGWILEIRDEDGRVGRGEAACWPGFGAGQRAVARSIASFTGSELPEQVDAVRDFETWMARRIWPSEVAFAVETAVLDLFEQRLGEDRSKLLGPTVKERRLTSHRLVLDHDEAAAAVASGAERLKWKLGQRDLDEELKQVEILHGIAAGVRIRLDVGGAWTLPQAERALTRLSDLDLDFVEQPLPPGHLKEMASLRRRFGVPLAVDEELRSSRDLAATIAAEAADVVVLKPMFVGGLFAARRLALGALSKDLRVVITHALESPIGRRAAIDLALSLPNGDEFHGLSSATVEQPFPDSHSQCEVGA